MHGNNPRKAIRKHIHFLVGEKARIDARSKKFAAEINRLMRLEHNGSTTDVASEAERWNKYNWFAFPSED